MTVWIPKELLNQVRDDIRNDQYIVSISFLSKKRRLVIVSVVFKNGRITG